MAILTAFNINSITDYRQSCQKVIRKPRSCLTSLLLVQAALPYYWSRNFALVRPDPPQGPDASF